MDARAATIKIGPALIRLSPHELRAVRDALAYTRAQHQRAHEKLRRISVEDAKQHAAAAGELDVVVTAIDRATGRDDEPAADWYAALEK